MNLKTNLKQGLTVQEAALRLTKHGPNELKGEEGYHCGARFYLNFRIFSF